MSDDKKKKRDEEDGATSTAIRSPADKAFAEWVVKQWRNGVKVDFIEVVEYFPKGSRFGQPVDRETFAGRTSGPSIEEAIDLTNRMIGSAQLSVDRVHRKPMRYFARAFDVARQSIDTPVDVFPIEILPKHRLTGADGDAAFGDDDDSSAKDLLTTHLKEGLRVLKEGTDRDDANVAAVVNLLLNDRKELKQWILDERKWSTDLQRQHRETLAEWVQAIREREAARSDEMERLPRIEMMKIKAELLRDTWKTGKNFLTGALASFFAGKSLPASGGGSSGGPSMSAEQMLIDTFFNDCREAKIDVALFGEWDKDGEGRPRCAKPGIFTPDQFIVLAGVHAGKLRPEALDELLPDSGRPLAITMEQLHAAQSLDGMTQGIGVSLVKLVGIREEARARARAAEQDPPRRPQREQPSPQSNTPSTPPGDAQDDPV